MSGSHVISLLTKKYAKLLGEYEFAERMTENAVGLNAIIEATNRCDIQKKEIDEKLAAIETVIWLFDPNWNPSTIRPNYPRKHYDKPGTISRTAYAVLRDAPCPLTSREIARIVAGRLGYDCPQERDMARIDMAIYVTLKARVGKTVQVMSSSPIRWALIPREQVQSRSRHRNIDQHAAPVETEAPQLQVLRLRASG